MSTVNHSENYVNAYIDETTFGDSKTVTAYQVVDIGSNKRKGSATGLTVATAYDFNITIDGLTLQQLQITTHASNTSYETMIALMNAAIVTGATGSAFFSVRDGNLRCDSGQIGTSSTILIAAGDLGGAGGDLFTALDDYVSIGGATAGTILTGSSQPFNESQIYPTLEYQQTAIESIGQGKSTKLTLTNSTTVLDGGEKHQYCQDDIWLVRALGGADGTDQAAGAVPANSWAEGFYDGKQYGKASGCYITEYNINLPSPTGDGTSPPKENITYNTYLVEYMTSGTIASPIGTQPNLHFDNAISLDGIALQDWKDATLTITKEWTEKTASPEFHKHPYLQKHSWTLDITTFNYPVDNSSLNILEYLQTKLVNLFSVVIKGWRTNAGVEKTLTLTNMKILPGSINIREAPEKGMKEYTFTIEIGGASTAILT